MPQGGVEAFLADHRLELCPDEIFEDLFLSKRGRPSIPADMVATVVVPGPSRDSRITTQLGRYLTGSTIKVACGLALDEEGFDYSVLTCWQTRQRNVGRPERNFQARRNFG